MTKPNHCIWPIRTHYTFVSTDEQFAPSEENLAMVQQRSTITILYRWSLPFSQTVRIMVRVSWSWRSTGGWSVVQCQGLKRLDISHYMLSYHPTVLPPTPDHLLEALEYDWCSSGQSQQSRLPRTLPIIKYDNEILSNVWLEREQFNSTKWSTAGNSKS